MRRQHVQHADSPERLNLLLARRFATLAAPLSCGCEDRDPMSCLPASSCRRRLGAGALASLAALGCASPFRTDYLSGSRRLDAPGAVQPAAGGVDSVAHDDPKTIALRKALGQEHVTQEQALAGVLDQIQEIGAKDPVAQQKLIESLKTAKPEHYPLIVEQFETALAYKQQVADRESEGETKLAREFPPADFPKTPTAHVVSHRPARANPAPSEEPALPAEMPATGARETPIVQTPRAKIVDAKIADEPVNAATAIAADGPDAGVQHAVATAPPVVADDWRAELDATIESLERSVKAQPSTIAELHDHLRLRALKLIAGRDEEAYLPIPGASPPQQDYWSKQLFAMSAYLNSSSQLDDKQRAAAALVHLDESRAALAQMATLQVRNLAFAEKVDGFGAYEPLKEAKFEPGTPVTLYAEVENFASASTKDGYETQLATSYQVVDGSGRRIDAAQFPEVDDVCRGRRRDFHLQYGVTLPRRISPGEYRLELTITDQQSGKIGQASVPFEINAER